MRAVQSVHVASGGRLFGCSRKYAHQTPFENLVNSGRGIKCYLS